MNMIKTKVDDLTGAALDFAVASCEYVGTLPFVVMADGLYDSSLEGGSNHYSPSTSWWLAGEILGKAKIAVEPDEGTTGWLARRPFCSKVGEDVFDGPTPLVAALRCYVASVMGSEVMVPEILLGDGTEQARKLVPIASNHEFRMVTYADLCATCRHCDYQIDDDSRCEQSWPGQEDENGDVKVCPSYSEVMRPQPKVYNLGEIQAMVDEAANSAVASIQGKLGQKDGGFAAVHFSGGRWEALTEILEGYARAEISHMQA